jgi:hypothetical protein
MWLALILAAQQPGTPPEIEWTAPEGCPTAEVLRARAEAYLGSSLDLPRPEAFSARAHATRQDVGFRLELELVAGGGRTVELHHARNCDDLSKLVAIKVALTLDPDAFVARYDAVEAEATKQAAPPEPEPKPEPRPEPKPKPKPEPSPRDLRLWLGVNGGVGGGVIPGLNGIVGAQLGFGGRLWGVETRGQVLPPTPVRTEQDPSVGADILAGTAAIAACARPELGPVQLPIWAGVDGGALRARGSGTTPERVAVRPYAAAFVGIGVAYWFRRVTVFVRPEVAVALSRPGFELDEGQVLYTVPAFSGRVLVGVDFDVWQRR